MKKITILSLIMLSIATYSCKDNASSKISPEKLESAIERDENVASGIAIIAFDKEVYDFGTIKEGEIAEGIFKITNKGKADLVITNASASCGCTVPSWPKDPILPGQTGELKFSFNSAGRAGKQHKSITLQTNTEKITETLSISGTVTAKESK
ncbi:DUF1573 domain-containing protein [Lutibacter sp.]|uniref:DUF1573 domain-containing protein n=1 Tax=Lutibacter sp. TaxID=1925666 RepID=UPI002733BC6F|nr:DUF1573 domain-containing protein [Lutibacter sp.]MDP3313532.1 DUF1573 domain-containing protein [Lutibacter sp.]